MRDKLKSEKKKEKKKKFSTKIAAARNAWLQ